LFDRDQNQLFTRRTFILGGIQGALALTLVGRLYYLQVLKGKHYQLLSDKNRIQTHYILPQRGNILDRNGYLLAENKNAYTAVLNPDNKAAVESFLTHIQGKLEISEQQLDLIKEKLTRRRRLNTLIIKENLTWEELAKLELHAPDLPGLTIEKGHSRSYPMPHETGHFIGYVGSVSDKELDQDPSLDLPGLRVGKLGLEKTYENTLKGKAGIKNVEVNALRKVVRNLDLIESVSGQDLTTNIDLNLQKAVYEALSKHRSAAAIVMDVQTGAVLSYVSYPGYDINLFLNALSKQDWENISGHEDKPLVNKIIAGQYAPGSTFKMMVALAGLNGGVINPSTTIHCPGHYDFYGHRFHCWNWKQGGHGHVNVQSAIAQSCDVYFYHVANQIGVDAIGAVAKSFGLGQLTGIDIPGEKSGLIPTRNWKSVVRRQRWTGGETINLSIGQGAILTTPLQLTRMTAMLVNGLVPIFPHIAKKDIPPRLDPLPYKIEYQKLIYEAMCDVVNKPWGTAHLSIPESPYSMGGKTGSTQVSRITQKERDTNTHNDRPYHLKEHSMFTGFAPIENPKFAVTVIVEHGGGGAKTAAPLAKEILVAAQKLVNL
jgi:penicillin-binding protein 2